MNISARFFVLLASACVFSGPALAQPLAVVNVAAPAINCVFNTSCTVVVTDSVGNFTPPRDSGNARLTSRTYLGADGAPAAGLGGYTYRVDMTEVQGAAAANCVTKLAVKFGPPVTLPYSPNKNAEVYVVTSGGLGSVGLSSAKKSGNTITFAFGGTGVCPGATSYFFALASKSISAQPGTAKLTYSLPGPAGTTDDRVP